MKLYNSKQFQQLILESLYELVVGCAKDGEVPGTYCESSSIILCIHCNGLYFQLWDLQSMLGLIE